MNTMKHNLLSLAFFAVAMLSLFLGDKQAFWACLIIMNVWVATQES